MGTITAGTEGVVATVTATGAGMLMSEDPVSGSSNTDGDFELTGLRAGTYHVTISDFPDIEFPVTTRDVTVGVGLSANVSFSAPGEEDPGDDTGAFIFISKVASEADDAGPAYSGRVTVTASVERGTARFEKLTLYVDGDEEDSQDFGAPRPASPSPGGPREDDPAMAAAQQVFDFELAFNSDAYEPHGDHTDVAYENGTHTLQVGLKVSGSETEILSNRIEAEFENDDGFVVTADLGDNSHVANDGKRWYGGPANGHIMISALAVSYSGKEMGAVTISLPDCKAERAENGDDNGDDHDHAGAGVSFEFDCNGEQAGHHRFRGRGSGQHPERGRSARRPTSTWRVRRTLRSSSRTAMAVRRAGSTRPWGSRANSARQERQGQLAGRGRDDTTAGVGGYNMGVRIGKDLKTAVRAGTSSLPAESAGNDAYCAVAVAMDDLGNMAPLPDTTGTPTPACRTAPDGADVELEPRPRMPPPIPIPTVTPTPDVWAYDSNDDGVDAIDPRRGEPGQWDARVRRRQHGSGDRARGLTSTTCGSTLSTDRLQRRDSARARGR